MDWSEGFIAVDWGTTNRRAYLLDGTGTVIAEMEDSVGVTAVPADGFDAAVTSISERLGSKPMLLAGMVGSNRGWREAPYLGCPATLHELARQILWVREARVGIVPGLSVIDGPRADVMRGEEVQAFGLARLGGGTNSMTVSHPGTHTKWVKLRNEVVTDFLTVMTGELFALLGSHSILAPLVQGDVHLGDAFLDGVEAGYGGGVLTAELFSVRARVLLSRLAQEDAASYMSGLLIGSDVRAGLGAKVDEDVDEDIVVVGGASLSKLYKAAIERCGFAAREVDGAQAFVAGMQGIKELIA